MYHHDVCSVSKCSILCSIRPPHNLETPPCLMFRKASRWAPRMTVPRMPGPASPQGAPQAKWANFQTMKSKIVASYIQWSASELCITKFNLKLCLIQASSQPDEKTVGKKEEGPSTIKGKHQTPNPNKIIKAILTGQVKYKTSQAQASKIHLLGSYRRSLQVFRAEFRSRTLGRVWT